MARWQISLLVTGTVIAIGAFIGVSLREPSEPGRDTRSSDVRAITKGDEYVAIGDSYTVAPASGRWVEPCMRTNRNYPRQVADKLGLRLKDVSCVGAATTHVTAAQMLRSTRIAPQADALSHRTALVTISLGANDFNAFRAVALGCTALRAQDPAGAPCEQADGATGGRTLEDTMTAIEQRVVDVIRRIAKRAPAARIMVVGYPEFFPQEGPCSQFPLALGDYRFAHRFNELLVRAQKRAAALTNVEYVDVLTPSRGHDMCAQDPWIAGVRSTNRAAMAWHPYPQEQRLVAKLIVDRLT